MLVREGVPPAPVREGVLIGEESTTAPASARHGVVGGGVGEELTRGKASSPSEESTPAGLPVRSLGRSHVNREFHQDRERGANAMS